MKIKLTGGTRCGKTIIRRDVDPVVKKMVLTRSKPKLEVGAGGEIKVAKKQPREVYTLVKTGPNFANYELTPA